MILKSYAVFILIFVLNVNAFSQKKIEGVGRLKIGTSKLLLNEIGYNLDSARLINQKDMYFEWIYKNFFSKELFQLEPDVNEIYTIDEASFHPSVKVFYLPKYEPVEGLVCEGITIKYFKDSLFYIKVLNPKNLEDAFKIKYGEPKLDLKEEEQHYVNGLGNNITKIDQIFKNKYKTGNPKVTCISTLRVWHDDKGKSNFLHDLVIEMPKFSHMVEKYDQATIEKIRKKEIKQKAKKLDDL